MSVAQAQQSDSSTINSSAEQPVEQSSQDVLNEQNNSVAQASSDASEWLENLARASQTLNYQISFVLLKEGMDSRPYVWRHAVMQDGTQMEQLNLLNGPGSEMLRVNDQVSYFEANKRPYTLQSDALPGPIPSRLLQNPLSLKESYDFVTVGKERVSGRKAQHVRIVSRDKSRFGYNLWLDHETGLLLKMDLVDMSGQMLEQLQVTELIVSPDPHPFFASVDIEALPDVLSLTTVTRNRYAWDLSSLPVGMETVKRDVHRLPLTGSVVSYLLLSDGLVDVSVYIQDQKDAVEGDVLLRHESNTLLTRQMGDVQVTVVGKVPPKTANDIASSVVLNRGVQ